MATQAHPQSEHRETDKDANTFTFSMDEELKSENFSERRKMPTEEHHSKMNGTAPDSEKKNEDDPALWAHKTRQCNCRRISVDLSTEEHFRVNMEEEDPIFVGAFGHIRKHHLDHGKYHAYYRKERQWLHDSIIEDYLVNDAALGIDDENNTGYVPQWLIFTAGIQGDGKHYSMRTLREEHALLLQHQTYCCVDTDELRRLLPEYDFYVQHAPQLVDALTQKEAGYIAETLCWAALQSGQSVFWDTSLRYPEWFVRVLIPNIRQSFPHLRVAVLHVMAPSAEVVQQRRTQKEQETGRHLFPDDLEYIESEIFRIQQAVEIVRLAVDFVVTVCNRDEGLEMIQGDWDGFLAAFLQDEVKVVAEKEMAESTPRRLPRLVSQESFIPTEDENLNETLNLSLRSMSYTQSSSSNTAMRYSFLSKASCSNISQSTSGTASTQGRRGTSRRRFSACRSTEDNHGTNHMKFYGRFAKIRATLDYTYHRNYTFERQRFQDSIIGYFLEGAVITDKDGILCTTPTEPWIVFTAGPMGAGKSYTMRQLVNGGRFPLVAFVNVDPDEIRRRFPEYQLYVNQYPELAGELTRKEAGFVAEILTLAALQAGKNVLQDGSLRDAQWYKEYFAKLRNEFPMLRLGIIQVIAPKEIVLERAAARGKQTGRIVPESVLLQAFEQVPISVEILGPLVDYHVTINNPHDADDVELVTPGETWASFTSQWVQTCAWVPKKKVQENLRKNYSRLSLQDELHGNADMRKNFSTISLPNYIDWPDEDTALAIDDLDQLPNGNAVQTDAAVAAAAFVTTAKQ